jgi:MFS family permease
VSPLRRGARRTFAALQVRNCRLWFTGQVISVSGTWMQTVAQAFLVLTVLHGTGLQMGLVIALQFVPMLLAGSFGGLVADRVDKRRLLMVTQASAAVLALVLGCLVVTGSARLWEVYLLALGLGVVNLFDNPARQSFVSEMVGRDLLPNAVSLNSVIMNSARVIGPAIGGVVILTVGLADCFFINAASFIAVIAALALMRPAELRRAPPVARAPGQIRAGLRYVAETPALRAPLLAMAVVGVFAFNFTTTLPLLAYDTFGGSAGTYSLFTAAMGAGAVLGGLAVAHRSRPSARLLGLIGLGFAAAMALVAAAPTRTSATVFLFFMGAGSISFVATANATVQLGARPDMRGRVMALYAIAFLGSTPIGAPIMGVLADAFSPRVALASGALATLLAAVYLLRQRLPDPSAEPGEPRPVPALATPGSTAG